MLGDVVFNLPILDICGICRIPQSLFSATDGRSAYFSIERFMLGNDHSSSLISAAEQGLRDTTFTANVKNWKIEDYASKYMEFHSTLNDQQERGTYSGMYENQKVEKFLDGLKHSHFIGSRSNILTNEKLRSNFNATATHVKDMVNQTPTV